MNVKETKYKIFCTKDYDAFKKLCGNRPVEPSRVRGIAESIKKVGQLDPAIVNEKFEVIDGQGRLEACRMLGVPFYYTIRPKTGSAECIEMNTSAKKWAIKDFVNMYALEGDASYQILRRRAEENPTLHLSLVAMIFSRKLIANRSTITNMIRAGQYDAIDRYENEECLEFVVMAKQELDRYSLDTSHKLSVLVFLYKSGLIDPNRMLAQLKKYSYNLHDSTKVLDVVEDLQNLYNFRRKTMFYFRDKYEEAMKAGGGSFSKKHGGKR